jgi:hypothetical protein
MTTSSAPVCLLAELEARQDEVLLRLEELERRIETALAEFAALKLPEFKPRKERQASAA